MICAGPYFTSDNTSNEPLEELITQVASLAPHMGTSVVSESNKYF